MSSVRTSTLVENLRSASVKCAKLSSTLEIIKPGQRVLTDSSPPCQFPITHLSYALLGRSSSPVPLTAVRDTGQRPCHVGYIALLCKRSWFVQLFGNRGDNCPFGEVLECHLFRAEIERHFPRRAIAVLFNQDVGNVFTLGIALIIILAINEHHHIRILLNAS